MLLPYLQVLNGKKVILGSQSQSRNELVSGQKLSYERIPSTFPQELDKNGFASAAEYNLATCRGKADELINRFSKNGKEWDLLICGDTVVVLDGRIIEKPENEVHCQAMVRELAARTHSSYTAHVVAFKNGPTYQWVTHAQVTFGSIPQQVIAHFAKQKEPYQHSGAYELNGLSASLLTSIHGSHTSVQGLDIHSLCNRIIQGCKVMKWVQ